MDDTNVAWAGPNLSLQAGEAISNQQTAKPVGISEEVIAKLVRSNAILNSYTVKLAEIAEKLGLPHPPQQPGVAPGSDKPTDRVGVLAEIETQLTLLEVNLASLSYITGRFERL